MISIASFVFNEFSENTFVLYDESKECLIFDPGCYTQSERDELAAFVEKNELKPVRLINTHCHVDHVFGNAFVAEKYDLGLEIHKGEEPVLEHYMRIASMYGFTDAQASPVPSAFLKEEEEIVFGNNSKLKMLFTPGHSPASLSFYSQANGFVIAGDVLFNGSIGRTDLPGGDFKTLMASIFSELLPLGDETKVYCGHGPSTTIGHERRYNPFLKMT